MSQVTDRQERRSLRDRRVAFNPNYLGPERRTGFDARGCRKISMSSPVKAAVREDNINLEWFKKG